jgi:uncharacterized protein YxjI
LDITIDKRPVSFGAEYDIETPGAIYFGKKQPFTLVDKLELQGPGGRVLAEIIGRISWFRSKHVFQLSDGPIYDFWCEKVWKRVFVCKNNNEIYRLYGHKGLNYSIFKDDQQIAAFTKNKIAMGKGNHYDIQMDDDANLVIVLCLVLTIDCSENSDNSPGVNVDLGNIGPEEKPFDSSWEPS